jgi:hypothetical protein
MRDSHHNHVVGITANPLRIGGHEKTRTSDPHHVKVVL